MTQNPIEIDQIWFLDQNWTKVGLKMKSKLSQNWINIGSVLNQN